MCSPPFFKIKCHFISREKLRQAIYSFKRTDISWSISLSNQGVSLRAGYRRLSQAVKEYFERNVQPLKGCLRP